MYLSVFRHQLRQHSNTSDTFDLISFQYPNLHPCILHQLSYSPPKQLLIMFQ